MRITCSKTRTGTVVLIAATVVAGAADAQVSFTEVGLTHGLGNDEYVTATNHGLGMNWIDFDVDGHPDLFAVNGFHAQGERDAHLYRNNDGDGTFTRVDELLPALPGYEQMASVFADYDRDGDPDIYIFTDTELPPVPNLDGPPNLLLKNLWVESGGTAVPLFEEVAAAAGVDDLADPPLGDYPAYRSLTGAFVDYDRDGWVDIYVGHWAGAPGGEPYQSDRIYRNDGDGTFTDVTSTCGIHDGADPVHRRTALAVLCAHLDDDLWPDIYVVNVFHPQPYADDVFYRNNGDGTFFDATGSSAGMGDDAGTGMGTTVGDIDLDGDWDLYISDLKNNDNDVDPPGNPLYLGNGDGTFGDNVADLAGVDANNSWGVNFIDLDLDGYEDLFVATMQNPPALNYVFMNQRDGTFRDVGPGSGIDVAGNARGSALADYDHDGDLDIALSYENTRLHLFRNDSVFTNHWLEIKLQGARSNLDAIGAVVRVTAGDLVMMRQVIAGDSGHGQNAFDLHFGLGDATNVDLIEIFWPCGGVNRHEDVAADQHVTYVETFAPDVDGDGEVSVADLLQLLGEWGPCTDCPGCLGDFDGSGVIDTIDLLQMLGAWG